MYSIFSAQTVFWWTTLNSVYSKLTYVPLFPSDNIISKIEKVKSFSKILLFQDLVKLLFIQ